MLIYKTIGSAWAHLVQTIIADGKRLTDGTENIANIIEKTNLLVEISLPNVDDEVLQEFGDINMISWMENNFLSQDPIPTWGYSYGERIFNFDGHNQFDFVVDRLSRDPLSKSSTICLLHPGKDNKHVPCVCVIDFKYRDGQLNLIAFLRSQDIGKKFYADAIALRRILAMTAERLQLAVGTLTVFVASAHIYENDLSKIRPLLQLRPNSD